MFAISERARQVFDDLNHFVDQRVRPAEIVFREQMKDAPEPFWRPPILQELKAEARWQDADALRWAARHWAARIGVKLTRLQLRPMATKWGSISTAGRLTLNTELLAQPKRLGEFVIVHELVHLLAPNHGRVFKSFMLAYLPDWRQCERELQHCATARSC